MLQKSLASVAYNKIAIEDSTPQTKPKLATQIFLSFIVLSDSLFGSGTYPDKLNRKWLVRYAGVALLLAVLQILRKPDSIFYAQFFAEDGSVFFREGLLYGYWHQIFTLYYGFPYLLQRVVAWILSPVSFAAAPTFYALSAVVLVSTAFASFCLPWFRHIIFNDAMRALVCVLIVLLPDSTILFSCLSNVTWYLAIWAMLLCMVQIPRSLKALTVLTIGYFFTTFTAPVMILLTLVWLIRGLRSFFTRNFRELFLAIVVLGSETVVWIITKNLGSDQKGTFDLDAFLNITTTRIFSQATLGTEVTKGINILENLYIVYWITFLVLIGYIILSSFIKFKQSLLGLFCAYIIISSVVLLLVGRSHDGWGIAWHKVGIVSNVLDGYFLGGRYFVMSILMIYIIFLAGADHLPKGKIKVGMNATLILIMFFATVQSFEVPPYPDKDWPGNAAKLYTKLATGDTSPLSIPIQPEPYTSKLNVATLMPEVTIPKDVILGELTNGKEFTQTFISQCPNLNQIDLFLTTYQRVSRISLNFRLKDAINGKVINQQIIDASKLKDNSWFSINFKPQIDSYGKHYLISLTSSESQIGNAISIWASNSGNAYPYGEAHIDENQIDQDLVFRYGCDLEYKP